MIDVCLFFFFFQAEDGIRDGRVTGVQTCALPILRTRPSTVEPMGYFSCRRSHGFDSSCFRPREMRRSLEFTLSTTHSISSPTLTSFEGCFMRLDHDISLTWTRPSMPCSNSTKAP